MRSSAARRDASGLLGIGIDVEDAGIFDRFGPAWLFRCADRWLLPPERAWWASRRRTPLALAVVLACKEAVYKAGGGPRDPGSIRLDLGRHGEPRPALLAPRDGLAPVGAFGWRVRKWGILAVAAVWIDGDRTAALAGRRVVREVLAAGLSPVGARDDRRAEPAAQAQERRDPLQRP